MKEMCHKLVKNATNWCLWVLIIVWFHQWKNFSYLIWDTYCIVYPALSDPQCTTEWVKTCHNVTPILHNPTALYLQKKYLQYFSVNFLHKKVKKMVEEKRWGKRQTYILNVISILLLSRKLSLLFEYSCFKWTEVLVFCIDGVSFGCSCEEVGLWDKVCILLLLILPYAHRSKY